ncbi:YcdB/YcdC domain-containing protein [Ureibacillus acetophenoni]
MRKFAILVTSTALTLGITTTIGQAQSPIESQSERIAIEVQSDEVNVSKSELIKKFKSLFPSKFDFLSENDFHLSNAHHYPDDARIRYDLSFHKLINGKDIYGSVSFVGDNLDIEFFYYSPITSADALFPAKVSKEEAQKIAENFLSKLPNGSNYELSPTYTDYYYNQLITEPIRYDFSFIRKQNNIPIADQQVYITVLGNGEIIQFNQFMQNSSKVTFDDVNQVKSKEEMLAKMKENLAVRLKYQINYDYRTGKESLALVYQPTINLGIHAINGEWQTVNGFTKDAPTVGGIELLSTKQLPAKYDGITVEQAKKLVQELLKIDSDKVKLNISSVNEYENEYGQPFLSIYYSYDWDYGGYGSTLEINKQTGEIVSYHDLKKEVLRELGEPKDQTTITKGEAQEKAIAYLNEWVPSYLHQYAKPINEPYSEEGRGIYHFEFPRVVNGIIVEGSSISVAVSSDGSLYSLYINHRQFDNWPSVSNVISSEIAKKTYIEALNLNLQYIRPYYENSTHYNLVYTPIYNQNPFSYLDATSGKWQSLNSDTELPQVTHPIAEEELNYLIQNRILEVDTKTFNADQSITNGEALKVLVKSLSYFYEYDYLRQQEIVTQTYKNIDANHPLYSVVEQAVRIGILDPNEAFNPETLLTKEQLAVWYIRALGLELAAKNFNIYNIDLTDKESIDSKYVGYVALADSLKLVTAENNEFKPKQEVTYANLATSIFPLAHAIHENRK